MINRLLPSNLHCICNYTWCQNRQSFIFLTVTAKKDVRLLVNIVLFKAKSCFVHNWEIHTKETQLTCRKNGLDWNVFSDANIRSQNGGVVGGHLLIVPWWSKWVWPSLIQLFQFNVKWTLGNISYRSLNRDKTLWFTKMYLKILPRSAIWLPFCSGLSVLTCTCCRHLGS